MHWAQNQPSQATGIREFCELQKVVIITSVALFSRVFLGCIPLLERGDWDYTSKQAIGLQNSLPACSLSNQYFKSHGGNTFDTSNFPVITQHFS